MKAHLYDMGKFEEIESPFDETVGQDLDAVLNHAGYRLSSLIKIPDWDFSNIEIYEHDSEDKSKEASYPYYACVSVTSFAGRDLFFTSWISVMHFLQHYTGWIKNLLEIEKLKIEIESNPI